MVPCRIVGMRAETHIHVGEGQQDAAIDLPVAREDPSRLPFIPGSGLKGAFRDAAKAARICSAKIDTLFGPEQGTPAQAAGSLVFSEVRLLALPIRSDRAPYLLVSSPTILRRFAVDLERCASDVSRVKDVLEQSRPNRCLAQTEMTARLEDLRVEFKEQGTVLDELSKLIVEKFAGLDQDRDALAERLVIVHDAIMRWLTDYALPVRARNVLNEDKVSKNLWYEETLPTDTLMYSLLAPRADGNLTTLLRDLRPAAETGSGACFLQIGGNETVGQGWFRLSLPAAAEGESVGETE